MNNKLQSVKGQCDQMLQNFATVATFEKTLDLV